MTLSHGFRHLANVLETLESNGLDVVDVAAADDERTDRLTIDMTVTVPIDPTDASSQTEPPESESDDSPTHGDDGAANDGRTTSGDGTGNRIQTATDVRERVIDAESADSEVDTADADGVDCPLEDCDSTFESDHGMKIHRTKVHGSEDANSEGGTPAYRDPDRLQEAYDDCNSFTEMKAALDTDVSAQTVRRQMIAHGFYEPGDSGSGSTASDPQSKHMEEAGDVPEQDSDGQRQMPEIDESRPGDAQTAEAQTAEAQTAEAQTRPPELESYELPEGVTIADLKACVCSAQTLYDVQQRFDFDRDGAMQLLEKYDLLDIVHGRVSNRNRRKQVDEAEITRRILEHAPVKQHTEA